jgi:alpha-galactosidase
MKNSTAPTERPANVEISFYRLGDMQVARYISATLVREEALEHGRLIGLYWSATGQVQRENVTATLTSQDNFGIPKLDPLAQPLQVFDLEIDGQSLHNHWEWVNATQRLGARPGTIEAVIELHHTVRPVTVKVVTRLDGTPVLARWLEITNTGDAPAALSHVSPWSGMLWNSDPAWNLGGATALYSLGYMPPENWGEEGDFTWHPLPQERLRIERNNNRFHGSPYWVIRNELTGELCFMALAWSGNHFAEFAYRSKTMLSFKTGPVGPAPLRVIAPGETVSTPEVHVGMLHARFDDAVSAWHQHIRSSVLPPRPAGKEMYTIAARVVEQPGDWILKEIDIAAEMGVEAFMVDAGWYGEEFSEWYEHRGDWFEGSWLPGGMAGIREHIHAKGMLFGLWLEPEAITRKSKLYAQHPDWVLKTDNGREVGTFGYGLDLANPAAARFFEESVIGVMRDFKLDFYKTDYNITTHEGGQTVRDGFAEHESWRHFETLYRVYDRVRSEYPQVALENCAGGGGRNDLGMMSRFHYCAESDYSSFPRSIRQINGMTLFLPPEAICYYHNHIPMAHQTADLDTHLRVTLFTVPLYVGFGAQNADRGSDYFATTRRYIELAKTFCRPIMANRPVVYHHTPDIGLFKPADWCVLEYAAPARHRAFAGVFKLNGGAQTEYVFRPRGLNLAQDYKVTLDNTHQTFTISGRELALAGLRVQLDAALTSELILFEAVTHA